MGPRARSAAALADWPGAPGHDRRIVWHCESPDPTPRREHLERHPRRRCRADGEMTSPVRSRSETMSRRSRLPGWELAGAPAFVRPGRGTQRNGYDVPPTVIAWPSVAAEARMTSSMTSRSTSARRLKRMQPRPRLAFGSRGQTAPGRWDRRTARCIACSMRRPGTSSRRTGRPCSCTCTGRSSGSPGRRSGAGRVPPSGSWRRAPRAAVGGRHPAPPARRRAPSGPSASGRTSPAVVPSSSSSRCGPGPRDGLAGGCYSAPGEAVRAQGVSLRP